MHQQCKTGRGRYVTTMVKEGEEDKDLTEIKGCKEDIGNKEGIYVVCE